MKEIDDKYPEYARAYAHVGSRPEDDKGEDRTKSSRAKAVLSNLGGKAVILGAVPLIAMIYNTVPKASSPEPAAQVVAEPEDVQVSSPVEQVPEIVAAEPESEIIPPPAEPAEPEAVVELLEAAAEEPEEVIEEPEEEPEEAEEEPEEVEEAEEPEAEEEPEPEVEEEPEQVVTEPATEPEQTEPVITPVLSLSGTDDTSFNITDNGGGSVTVAASMYLAGPVDSSYSLTVSGATLSYSGTASGSVALSLGGSWSVDELDVCKYYGYYGETTISLSGVTGVEGLIFSLSVTVTDTAGATGSYGQSFESIGFPASGDSGDTGDDTGDTGGDTGDTGGDTGDTGGDTGDTGGDSGDTGGDSGDTGGDTGGSGDG